MVDRQRVVVVTGGGGGIGAAIAEELGRNGAFVVTMDPLVSVDGTEQLPVPEETTAGRIVAAGGSARASRVSVTDADGVCALFDGLVNELGGLDAVVNVAGITRPTSFARGSDEDWLGVLSVHLDGYLNILNAALPIMAASGRGRILGVTSGSGWRPADTGAYGCAKRAVAALTWQLGRHAPPGVVVNAVSPIAATRMVTAALSRARPPAAKSSGKARPSATGGLSLASMPTPEALGPLGAHLVSDAFSWCSGEVIFAGGSEIAVIDEPRLLEVVRTEGVGSLRHVFETVTTGALVAAEVKQRTSGGSNARFPTVFEDAAPEPWPEAAIASCLIVTDRPDVEPVLRAALASRGVTCSTIDVTGASAGFDAAAAALASTVDRVGPIDGVVLALTGNQSPGEASAWAGVLAEHEGIVRQLHTDASWARAVSDYSERADRAVRLVTVTDATTAGGRSRAQAAAQHARSARGATDDRVLAFTVGLETPWADAAPAIGDIVAHLLCSDAAAPLSGAELAVGAGWFGLRSHPHPSGSITFGGPAIPDWFDNALRDILGRSR
ncbi:MAG: SDR family NAD(P)-dependent oxidoreductase [Acidimicrobiales bacterium]